MPDATNPLSRIKHVVVLMMENRSFDNLLGWLYDGESPPRGQPFEGLHRGLFCTLDNVDSDGLPFIEKVFVRKNGEPVPSDRHARPGPPNYRIPSPDPGEGYRCTNHQLFGHYQVALEYPPDATNLGFVNDYRDAMLFGTFTFGEPPGDPRDIMVCFTPEQVPVLSTLAKQFAVCDHWHASVPSQTLPNRYFVHAATSQGQVNNKPTGSCGARTIFNQIQDAIASGRTDLSWRLYCGTSQGQLFSLTRLTMTALQDKTLDPNFQPLDQFYKDATAGTLPSYAFLEPQIHAPGANDQHPPQDVRAGDKLIADLYTALVNGPAWTETLFVITYDEHGGCYDHVSPPKGAVPPDRNKPAGQDGFLFNRFGVRVPTVVVSPWIEAGTVLRPAGYTPFDHTTVLATVRNCFNLPGPLTERDKNAPDLGCAFTRTEPRTDRPAVRPLPLGDALTNQPTTDLHRLVGELKERKGGGNGST